MNYGFSDSHGTLITYTQFDAIEQARDFAQDLADLRGEAIGYWLDDGDADSDELTAHPSEASQ